ncbi:Asp/Glu/hydantoin racemase [Amorphus sp. 3PC139-8]|uniref:maleate cis-trans isomerase family protein n=1 Tax=Amorphus sp. 3PC139-8 TaxID=2735676 RepID=UPI00345DE362
MTKMIRIGHITPSSNTALEPLTYQMNRPYDSKVSHHFSRTGVTHLALAQSSEAQFQIEPMLAAARLLADAPLDLLVWNGTSASWRGLANDEALCAAITKETGVPATTSTIGFYAAFQAFGWSRIGLALPYTADVSAEIEAEYVRRGYTVTANACLGLRENRDIGAADPEAIRDVLRRAAAGNPDCIAVVCTNFNATELVDEMEAELGVPIVDSIAVTLWQTLREVGVEVRIPGWGRVLSGA